MTRQDELEALAKKIIEKKAEVAKLMKEWKEFDLDMEDTDEDRRTANCGSEKVEDCQRSTTKG